MAHLTDGRIDHQLDVRRPSLFFFNDLHGVVKAVASPYPGVVIANVEADVPIAD